MPVTHPAPVSVTVALLVAEPDGAAIRLNIVQQVELRLGHAPAGNDPVRLAFPIPSIAPSAGDTPPVEFVGGWRHPEVSRGVITDIGRPTAERTDLAYAVVLRPSADVATLRWTLPYGATDVEMLFAERGLRAQLPGMHDRGTVTEHGRRYRRWSAGSVAPGDSVSIRLDGRTTSDAPWPAAAAAAMAAVLAGGLIAALRTPKRDARDAASGR